MTSNNISNAAPLVLIADDLPDVIRGWESALDEYGIRTIKALSLKELSTIFFTHQHEIAAIILDGCMPGHSVNTTMFSMLSRQVGFRGPIIAASSSAVYRQEMMKFGCSHQAPKGEAAHLVADLLSRS